MKLTPEQKEALIYGYNKMRGKIPDTITIKNYKPPRVIEFESKINNRNER